MLRSLLVSRITLLVLFGLLIWGGILAGQEINRYMQLSKKAVDLRDRVSELEKTNRDVEGDFGNKDETGLIEREARRRLNLKKPNEEVVIIIPGDEEMIIEAALRAAEKNETMPRAEKSLWEILGGARIQKWLDFLGGSRY